jgi:SET domain-containing protein
VDNELRDGEPIATLIAGRYGNWTKFINHRDDGMHNVEFIFVPIGGKMRLVLQAVRNIRAGEELVTTYGNQYFVRRSTRKRKRRKLSI